MCHRRSRIEIPEIGGLRESLLHVLMLTEGAIPLGLTLFAEPTPLMVSALAASAVVHQTTAAWDVRVADDSDRRVSPLEQQIHSALEATPFIVCLLGALRMTGTADRLLEDAPHIPAPSGHLCRCRPPGHRGDGGPSSRRGTVALPAAGRRRGRCAPAQ